MESERRLLYVAITRARERLYLLTPHGQNESNSEIKNEGKTGEMLQQPSLFIEEMQLPLSQHMAEAIQDREPNVQTTIPLTRLTLRYLEACDYHPEINAPRATVRKPQLGDGIRHRKLGSGRVIKWEGDRLEVLFSDRQTRRFDWLKLAEFLL
jgi:DNA helicase-2/ATP-dependent DNA helicase PcrA